jgi:WD40 repeat protein
MGHTGSVNEIALMGNLAISRSDDTTLRVWDLEEGSYLGVFTGDAMVSSCASSRGSVPPISVRTDRSNYCLCVNVAVIISSMTL